MKQTILAFCIGLLVLTARAEESMPVRMQDILLQAPEHLTNFEVPSRLQNDPEFHQFVRYVFEPQPYFDVRQALKESYSSLGMGPVQIFEHMKSTLAVLGAEAEKVQRLKETLLHANATAFVNRLKLEAGVGVHMGSVISFDLGWREQNGRVTLLLSCGLKTLKADLGGAYVGIGTEAYSSCKPLQIVETQNSSVQWITIGIGKSRTEYQGRYWDEKKGKGEGTTLAVGLAYSEEVTNVSSHYINIPFATFRGPSLRAFDRLHKLESRMASELRQLRFDKIPALVEAYRDISHRLDRSIERQEKLQNMQRLLATHPFYSVQSLLSTAPRAEKRGIGKACLALLTSR